jgi:hypothetical protein
MNMRAYRVLRRPLVVALIAGLSALLVFPLGHRATAATTPPHVMIVLMENTSYEQIVGNSQMPFVNGQVAANGSVSTTDLSHPSEPNYLGITSGSIYDNPADLTPQDETYAGPQFTDELAAAGISWKAYIQDMASVCDLTDQFGPGNYDVNHNPFMYFNTVRNNSSQCNRVVPYPQLTTDLNSGTAPSFIWVTPNTIFDMHDAGPGRRVPSRSGRAGPGLDLVDRRQPDHHHLGRRCVNRAGAHPRHRVGARNRGRRRQRVRNLARTGGGLRRWIARRVGQLR